MITRANTPLTKAIRIDAETRTNWRHIAAALDYPKADVLKYISEQIWQQIQRGEFNIVIHLEPRDRENL